MNMVDKRLEESVLGALLLDNDQWDAVARLIKAEDFWYESNRVIFQSIEKLISAGKPADLVTVTSELLPTDDTISARLIGMMDSVPLAHRVPVYARQLLDLSLRRQIESTWQHFISEILKPEVEVGAALTMALGELSLLSSRDVVQDKRDVLAEAMSIFPDDEGVGYLTTGIDALDRLIGGIPKGLTVIGARPSMGKSALARTIARNMQEVGVQCMLLSEDQSTAGILRLEASRISKVPLQVIKNGTFTEDQRERWHDALAGLTHTFPIIDDQPLVLDDMVRKIRENARAGVQVFFVDYLQLVKVKGAKLDDAVRAVSKISITLKGLARELDIFIVALCQLSRGVEYRDPPRPMLSDLRESGQIEQDADLVMLLYREDYYKDRDAETMDLRSENPFTGLAATAGKISRGEIIIAKNKEGPVGMVYARFNETFTDWTSYE